MRRAAADSRRGPRQRNGERQGRIAPANVRQQYRHLFLIKSPVGLPGTENQAFNAIVFFYQYVLEKPLLAVDALRASRLAQD
jgi:hypothetical protein